MKRYKLKNKLTIIEVKRKSDIVTVQITVNAGSTNEKKEELGISHFIEHMVFEGTKKRSSEEIANTIESLGGEISAFTSHETTSFYVKIIKKHFDTALDILSDILINPIFDQELIEKEREVILSEIKMVLDQPRHYQWILFLRTLYNNFPAKNPIYGTVNTVRSLIKQDLADYHNRYYTAPNMVITVVGDIKNAKQRINKYFNKLSTREVKICLRQEKANIKTKKIEKRKTNQSYVVLGYKTAKRKEYDSYVLDVIRAVLGRGLSGKLFREIRVKRGLAYDVGIYHNPNISFGAFAAYFSTNKKNINKAVEITLNEFKKLKNISSKDLLEAKQFIEGEFVVDQEDSQSFANLIGDWELSSRAEDCINYIKKIKKVSKRDIKRVVGKYLNDRYSLAIIEQA